MKGFSLLTRGLAALGAAALLLATAAYGQGVTTSAINGFVTDPQGRPLSGAVVTVVLEDTGTRAQATTNADGQYNLPGLRIGGPYTVTVDAAGYHAAPQEGIFLNAGVAESVNFRVSSEIVHLQAFHVTESRDPTFSGERTSNSTMLAATQIEEVPVVRQDIQELADLDPRINLVENTSTGEFQLSAQGQNFRYNSFLIDGLESNDPFGLNGNGFASQRSPVPLQALENFSVNFSPYDVRYTGFTGALMNAVTKSGTNTFHGSIDYRYSDQDLRGKNPVSGERETFRDRTYTLTLGGPIVRDRLFFFLAYDDFRRVAAPPFAYFVPTDPAQIQQIVAKAKSYGYDPGDFNANNVSTQKTYLAKIDWNINEKHHLKVSYRRTDGSTPQFAAFNYTFTTSFSNHWFQQPRVSDNYVAQLDSQWTSNFHTEATVAYLKYDGTPRNNGKPFPQVTIDGITGREDGAPITTGSVILGTEYSRMLNAITTKDKLGKFYADYTWGNHVFLAGVDADKTDYNNRFVQYYYGAYQFDTVADWLAGGPVYRYQDAQLFPGYTLDSAFAEWSATSYGAVLQDTWRPNERLTLTGGLRLTYPYVPTSPAVATGFATAGFTYRGAPITRNNTTNNGNETLAPRLSFNYEVPADRKTAIRGGVGLFSGTNPAVWLSNAYSKAGQINTVTATRPKNLTFEPDVTQQPVPPGTLPTPEIDVTDPDFRTTTYWKSNLALDHQLPFLGLILTIEGSYNKVAKAPFVAALNMKRGAVAFGPDGRERYAGSIYPGYRTGVPGVPTGYTSMGSSSMVLNPKFYNVYYLTDTNRGSEHDVTIGFHRPMKNRWAFSFYWTRMHATEVTPLTSSVAGSNFTYRPVVNPNEDVAYTSNYEVPDKIVATLSHEFRFLSARHTSTFVSAVFRSQTGHPYSWVFRGDANGDGISGNDLFYMPAGPNDPRVTWYSPAERDAFFAFAAANGLNRYAGMIIPRNSDFSEWQKTLDVHISQQIPIYGHARLELFLDCINFANLLNKHWGVVEGIDYPYTRSAVGATITADNKYEYFFNNNTKQDTEIFTDLARWQMQAGARLKF